MVARGRSVSKFGRGELKVLGELVVLEDLGELVELGVLGQGTIGTVDQSWEFTKWTNVTWSCVALGRSVSRFGRDVWLW